MHDSTVFLEFQAAIRVLLFERHQSTSRSLNQMNKNEKESLFPTAHLKF